MMKRSLSWVAVALLPLGFVPASPPLAHGIVPTGSWTISPERSIVHFTATKLGFADVPGRFLEFSGTVRYNPECLEESFVAWGESYHAGELQLSMTRPAEAPVPEVSKIDVRLERSQRF